MNANVGIINTAAGNLTSLKAALVRIGLDARILNDPSETESCSHLLIPGQGRFGTVMENLEQRNWLDTLNRWYQDGKPIFGICVGFQVFFESSEEDPNVKGLGWLKGEIKRLKSPKQPMVGWSEVYAKDAKLPFSPGIAYFVNSFVLSESQTACGFTEYGQEFVSAIKHNNICGVQFHPEKSSAYGMEVLKQCLAC